MINLIESIKENEGFEGMPYKDTRGFLTIGYGTKLPITEKEASMLLENRLNNIKQELLNNKPFVTELPEFIQEVLFEMGYQLGVPKQLLFIKMWKAIENRDWDGMIKEMIDSKWYRETPNRVKNLIKRIQSGEDKNIC